MAIISFCVDGNGNRHIDVSAEEPTNLESSQQYHLEISDGHRIISSGIPKDILEALVQFKEGGPHRESAHQEIERKFIVLDASFLTVRVRLHIEQTYLVIAGDLEVRVRKIVANRTCDQFMLTAKMGRGISRKECDVEIPKSTFSLLLDQVPHRPLKKTRDLVLYGFHAYEIDSYPEHPEIAPLQVAEVEFDCMESGREYRPPSWLGEEVTDTLQLKNQSLWRKIQNQGRQ